MLNIQIIFTPLFKICYSPTVDGWQNALCCHMTECFPRNQGILLACPLDPLVEVSPGVE